MNLLDESFLSAYLDDELDPARRLLVESAVRSSPRLAERLRELASVRHLVASMGRPTSTFDLTAPLLGQLDELEANRGRRAAWSRWLVSRNGLIASGISAAAVLMVAVGLGGAFRRPHVGPGRNISAGPAVTVAHPKSLPEPGEPKAPVPTAVAARATPQPTPSPVLAGIMSDAERRLLGDQQRARELLDRNSVRRINLVLDKLDAAALRRIDDLIQLTARKSPVQVEFRLGRGMIIDPAQPREAVVYALVLDGVEHARFRQRLAAEFPTGIGLDELAAPAVVTQLADVGNLRVFEGIPKGSLKPPPDDVMASATALRRPKDKGASEKVVVAVPEGGSILIRKNGNTLRDEAPTPAARASADRQRYSQETQPASTSGSPAGMRGDDSSSVYLLWVTTQGSGGR